MSNQQPGGKPHHHAKPNTVGWYFEEFWPIMIFVLLFVLMCAMPIILSGVFADHDAFSASDSLHFGYGLAIIGAFLLAMVVMFVWPHLMGWYLFVLALSALVILTDKANALKFGPWIAILFLGFNLFGNIVLPKMKDTIYKDLDS